MDIAKYKTAVKAEKFPLNISLIDKFSDNLVDNSAKSNKAILSISPHKQRMY